MSTRNTDHRAAWLGPPGAGVRLDRNLAANARRALTVLRKQDETAEPTRRHRLLLAEADASSLIEQVNADPTDRTTYAGALAEAMTARDGTTEPEELLRWHGRLMRDHPRPDIMTPGSYRQVGVTVGGWLPPPYQEVPRFMERFHQWLAAESDPLMRAVWGHRYFETIHPFADGNGRTGRLLIIATLEAPICISRALWWERSTYMTLLGQGNWREWSDWMLEKIREEAYRSARDLRAGPLQDTDRRAARWLTQRPLPKIGKAATTMEMIRYHNAVEARIELEDN